MEGSVYVLTNPAMPNMVKIGETTRDVELRLADLYSTGVPLPCECEYAAKDLGLNETEFAFYNILNAEVVKSFGEETFSDEVHERILSLVKKLVNQFEESSKIVGFFLKQDEIKTMQRNIKRAMIEDEFDDPELRKIVIERFMELAKVKFK